MPPPKPLNLEIPDHPNLVYIVKNQIMLTLLFILAVQGQAAAEDPTLPQLAEVVADIHPVRVSQTEIEIIAQ